MNRWRRSLAAFITVGGLLFATAGCSGSITTNGAKITDPENALSSALTKLKQDNDAGIQNGSVTISDSTSCFYVKPNAEAEDVSDQVACGPVRRLGKSDQNVWDTYTLKYAQNADGDVTAAVDSLSKSAVTVDPQLLVSPDDTEPAAVSDVPAPQAPPTTITNTALTLTSADGLGSFSKLDKPVKLITPAAAIELTEVAQPQYMPSAMVQGSGDPSGAAPYYRPAEGQKVYAYKYKVGPSPESAVLGSSTSSGSEVNMDTAVTLGIGGETVNIATSPEEIASQGGQTWSLSCGAEGFGASFPCDASGTTEGVLVMTVPADSKPTLVASVNGDTQSADLATGAVTSSVSQVEYNRSKLAVQLGKTIKSEKVTVKDGDSEESEEWSMSVDGASISAFDPYRGWAPKGKAWLVVQTSDIAASEGFLFEADLAKSVTLTVDGKPVTPNGLSEVAEYKTEVNWVFEVPEDTTDVTFNFKPTGEYTGATPPKPFTAAKATGYDISLPA